ncbi:MAG: hypothetical protein JWP43_2393 [Ramlibacter sp.]|nr:hypothetical protein [Ramlibacter sp.]
MDQTAYHVLLEGSRVGPYDRRTIVGMRIKKALTSDHVLVGADGTQLTVGELIRRRSPTPFNPERSGSYSVVQGAYAASLVQVSGSWLEIPRFKGEVEARVQADGVLRLAGRFRRGFGWKDGRVKIALKAVAHVRVAGTQVELGLRGDASGRPAQLTLDLFTPETANEFVQWLPDATPFPAVLPNAKGRTATPPAASQQAVWMAAVSVSSVAVVVAVVFLVVLYRGGH